MNLIVSHKGQSIIEIVISLAIFILIITALTGLVLGSFTALERGNQFIRAGSLAQEGLEAVRSIRDRDWDNLIYSRSAVAISGNQWIFVGEGTTNTIDDFTRVIDFYPVYRNGSNEIVAASDPGAVQDTASTRVVVGIFWEIRPGVNNTITRTTYLTNWRN